MTRRGLLKGGVIFGGAFLLMARPWTWGRAGDIRTEPMAEIAPFRRLLRDTPAYSGGAGAAVMVGLEAPEPVDPALEARLRGDLTGTLWGDWEGTGPVPVTYFTDIRCPICRPLEARLHSLEGIALTTREFPIFGEASEVAAQAVITAEQQGLGEAMRRRLHRASLGVAQTSLAQLAERIGADPDQFSSDFNGNAVTARLQEDRALARIFRLPGTPGMVIGRTRVVGAPPDATLIALIAEEAALGRP